MSNPEQPERPEGGGPIVLGLELDTRVEARLRSLAAAGEGTTLRRFAAACVRRTQPGNLGSEFLEAAEEEDEGRMQQLRARHQHYAMGATISGLKRGLPGAAAFLTAYQAVSPDPLSAALGAARMEILHVRLSGDAQMTAPSAAQWAWLNMAAQN